MTRLAIIVKPLIPMDFREPPAASGENRTTKTLVFPVEIEEGAEGHAVATGDPIPPADSELDAQAVL